MKNNISAWVVKYFIKIFNFFNSVSLSCIRNWIRNYSAETKKYNLYEEIEEIEIESSSALVEYRSLFSSVVTSLEQSGPSV